MDSRNNLYQKALSFSKAIVLLYRELEKRSTESELSKQLLRSGTAVGANISEAQGSISEADYVSKIHIAYKELLETKYWIDLLCSTNDISKEYHNNLDEKITELSKILYTILKNIRSKKTK